MHHHAGSVRLAVRAGLWRLREQSNSTTPYDDVASLLNDGCRSLCLVIDLTNHTLGPSLSFLHDAPRANGPSDEISKFPSSQN